MKHLKEYIKYLMEASMNGPERDFFSDIIKAHFALIKGQKVNKFKVDKTLMSKPENRTYNIQDMQQQQMMSLISNKLVGFPQMTQMIKSQNKYFVDNDNKEVFTPKILPYFYEDTTMKTAAAKQTNPSGEGSEKEKDAQKKAKGQFDDTKKTKSQIAQETSTKYMIGYVMFDDKTKVIEGFLNIFNVETCAALQQPVIVQKYIFTDFCNYVKEKYKNTLKGIVYKTTDNMVKANLIALGFSKLKENDNLLIIGL